MTVGPHMGGLQAPASRQLHEQTLGRGDGDTACLQRAIRRDAGRGSRGVMWRLCGGLQLEKWDFPLVSHFRFSGRGMYRFPKKCYPGNGKHCRAAAARHGPWGLFCSFEHSNFVLSDVS